MRRPPLAVVLVAILMIALGETAGAAMSQLRPQIRALRAARVSANAPAHGLSGSAEYDEEVVARAVFTAEAGLSFFHTHAEGVGLVLFFASTLVASLRALAPARALLYTLLTLGGLFPAGLSRVRRRRAGGRVATPASSSPSAGSSRRSAPP